MKMLDSDEKLKYRPHYFKILKRMGWIVVYDDNPDLDNTLYDISLMCTKKMKDKDTGKVKTYYGFFKATYNSAVSYDAFRKAWIRPEEGAINKMIDVIHSMIYPYELDDVIAQLLHLGYHIQNVYTVQNGKLALNLNSSQISSLITEFNTKGSPLLDPTSAARPKKVRSGKVSGKSYYNVLEFGQEKKS